MKVKTCLNGFVIHNNAFIEKRDFQGSLAGFAAMKSVFLDPKRRVLFLTKDLNLIKAQLYEGLNLYMKDINPEDLLDDINTDVMTPAWVCFDYQPTEIAKNAYAGLLQAGGRVFKENALLNGNFQVIVSGQRKGTGSSRETAAQCERFCGIEIAIAASFAPIHAKNNANLGQLMGNYALLVRLQAGEQIPLDEWLSYQDPLLAELMRQGGLFGLIRSQTAPKPMTMPEKILAMKSLERFSYVKPGQTFFAKVDGGYSHEFTSAQVHLFLKQELGENYTLKDTSKFAVFEDHLIYTDQVPKMALFKNKIQTLRDMQKAFQKHTGVRDYSAKDGVSPGICHEVAKEAFIEPGDLIQSTDSHTCMGGALNAMAYGVGATEYAALLGLGVSLVEVPHSIRFELKGKLKPHCTAKDLMLYILSTYAKEEKTLNKVMELGGEGLSSLSLDERATLCNMATECSAKTAICEPDDLLKAFIREKRPHLTNPTWVYPDKGAFYGGGIHTLQLDDVEPMVALPGDPTYSIPLSQLPHTPIQIAYGGSCTAGKIDDLRFYAQVTKQALQKGLRVHPGVKFYIQFGSKEVKAYSQAQGFMDLFKKAGVILLEPGCGACIGCGPGVSEHPDQVTISAINRNFYGRSGPGKLYLGSPLTVATSAFLGHINCKL